MGKQPTCKEEKMEETKGLANGQNLSLGLTKPRLLSILEAFWTRYIHYVIFGSENSLMFGSVMQNKYSTCRAKDLCLSTWLRATLNQLSTDACRRHVQLKEEAKTFVHRVDTIIWAQNVESLNLEQ